MDIYIMTRGRIGKQRTLSWIPTALLPNTYLIVPKEEHGMHEHQTVGVPSFVTDYSKKFQWLLDGGPFQANKFVIMDDDLVFSKPDPVTGKLKTLTNKEDLAGMFSLMEDLLDDTPLVGVHPRQHGDKARRPYTENGKIICIQGINRSLVGPVTVDQFPILADVMLNCTLLSRGQENKLITSFCQDHGPCQAEGGCSIYRTPEMQEEAVRFIAEKFAPHAKAVVKTPKTAKWMGETRVDLRVAWKKMAAAGKNPNKHDWQITHVAPQFSEYTCSICGKEWTKNNHDDYPIPLTGCRHVS